MALCPHCVRALRKRPQRHIFYILTHHRLPFLSVESGSVRCIKKNFGDHLNFWDKGKPQYPVFHSFELTMHTCVGGWFLGVFPR